MPIPRPVGFEEKAARYLSERSATLDERVYLSYLFARTVLTLTRAERHRFFEEIGPEGRNYLLHNADEMLIGGPARHSFSIGGRQRELTKGQFFRELDTHFCLHCRLPFDGMDMDTGGGFCKSCAFDLAFTGENIAALAQKLRKERRAELIEELGEPAYRARPARGFFTR